MIKWEKMRTLDKIDKWVKLENLDKMDKWEKRDKLDKWEKREKRDKWGKSPFSYRDVLHIFGNLQAPFIRSQGGKGGARLY